MAHQAFKISATGVNNAALGGMPKQKNTSNWCLICIIYLLCWNGPKGVCTVLTFLVPAKSLTQERWRPQGISKIVETYTLSWNWQFAGPIFKTWQIKVFPICVLLSVEASPFTFPARGALGLVITNNLRRHWSDALGMTNMVEASLAPLVHVNEHVVQVTKQSHYIWNGCGHMGWRTAIERRNGTPFCECASAPQRLLLADHNICVVDWTEFSRLSSLSDIHTRTRTPPWSSGLPVFFFFSFVSNTTDQWVN